MKFSFTLLIIAILSTINTLPISYLPITPKAADLDNHFGTYPSDNIYGPHHNGNEQVNLAREGVATGVEIKPITNFNQEINPDAVFSGNLDNTSPDASLIVTPEYAKPILNINTNINHDAIVETPVQLGVTQATKTLEVVDKITGKVNTSQMKVERPVLGVVKNLRNVNTNANTIVDLSSGKILKPEAQIGFVGTEPQ